MICITQKGTPSYIIGEVEIHCRWLGAHGIPVLFVTGDREAAHEANQFNPYRHVCCVKSYYQTQNAGGKLLTEKLVACVNASMKLDASFCVSHDVDKLILRFHNPDTLTSLAEVGYAMDF